MSCLCVVQQAVAFYLGIDGGGSKTTCLVGDETSTLGRGDGGASNVVRVGEAGAREALLEAVRSACANAGVDPARISRTVAGVAGAGSEEVCDFLGNALRDVVDGEVSVVTDAATSLYAAFETGPGVIVIAGTGSIALAQDGRGNTARAGGWGWAISDEGSGPWIGRAAVAAVLREREAARVSAMEQSILRVWQLSSYENLVRAANATPQPDFGALLPEVVAAAKLQDAAAGDALARAGAELANLARTVAARVLAGASVVPVAMSGGALAHAPELREAFQHSLKLQVPNVALRSELVDPVLGALSLARRG